MNRRGFLGSLLGGLVALASGDVPVVAAIKPPHRTLQVKYSIEPHQELRALYGVDAEDELVNKMVDEILKEVTNDFLNKMGFYPDPNKKYILRNRTYVEVSKEEYKKMTEYKVAN